MKYNEELYSMSKTAQRAQLIQKRIKKRFLQCKKDCLNIF